jgi:acetylornithine deacetylase
MADRSDLVLSWLEERRQDIVDFVSLLVSTPSINPPGNEEAMGAAVQAKMEELGMTGSRVIARRKERPNVLYRLRGSQDGPTLLYNAHMDTKPVGEEAAKLWKSDPLTPTIRDGKLYGLGVADMKSTVGGMVYAVAALKELVPERKGDLLLILSADEEAGTGCGPDYLVQEHGITADFGFIGEPQGITEELEFLPLISRGISCFMVKVYGTQMHSSLSNALPSVNASAKMSFVLQRMYDELRDRIRYPQHPLAPLGITVNVGNTVQGGVFYGVYPGYAEFRCDIRTLPGMTKENLKEDIDAFLDDLRHEDPDLKVEWEFADPLIDWYEPSEVSADEPFVEMMLSASERVLGRRPPLGTFPGGTDAFAWQIMGGIPTIPGFGPGLLKNCHGPNEWAGVDTIIQATKIYALAAMEYLKP